MPKSIMQRDIMVFYLLICLLDYGRLQTEISNRSHYCFNKTLLYY